MTQIITTDNGWKSTQRDPVDGDVIGIRLVYKTGTLHPSAVRVATASAAPDFPYDHDRSSTENAADVSPTDGPFAIRGRARYAPGITHVWKKPSCQALPTTMPMP